jgi:NTE family protein
MKHFVCSFLCILLLLSFASKGQKVGVVLSGGGADGLSHIGVLKALEENNIPIDYITGTSMGALIGALYASGYSPAQMEVMANSERFKNWAQGEVEEKYVYYFKKKDADASWTSFKFSLDTSITASIPTNFINPIPIDFALMELFAKSAASAKYNFDSLFIPFRCVGSDVTSKQEVIFKKGDLGRCVRASMSYPFYIKPILIDGKLFFDGGLYNNFPVDVMFNDFKPDVIIGSNVSENIKEPDEDNVIGQIKSMLVNRNPNVKVATKLVVIEPKVGSVGLFEFNNSARIMDFGYTAANQMMDSIKTLVGKKADNDKLNKARNNYMVREHPLVFEKITIDGLKKSQAIYVKRLLGSSKRKAFDIAEMKSKYFRLVADDKIKQIYPLALYSDSTGFYDLLLKIKKEKDIFAYFGGNVSSRPINTGYIGLQYNYLSRVALTSSANIYFGKLYGSYQGKFRFDFSSRYPFYVETSVTRSRWDFFKSSTAFFEESKPSFLLQNDLYGDVNIALPVSNRSKLIFGNSFGQMDDRYYQTKQFSFVDTTDRSKFSMWTPYVFYEKNTQNKKQFANSGTCFSLKLRYMNGVETTIPGSTSIDKTVTIADHEWLQLKMLYDSYYKRKGHLRLGVYTEAVVSNQDFFANYTASILSAPAFSPIPESKTLFLPIFRAHSFVAFGSKNVISLHKNFDIRLEGYVFQPYREILKNADGSLFYGEAFAKRYFMASAAIVAHTFLGPLSLSANYYDLKENSTTQLNYSILVSFGYIIYNRKSND